MRLTNGALGTSINILRLDEKDSTLIILVFEVNQPIFQGMTRVPRSHHYLLNRGTGKPLIFAAFLLWWMGHLSYQHNDTSDMEVMSHEKLQGCIDDYIATGAWEGDKWIAAKNPCDFQQWSTHELTQRLDNMKLLFTGDSTTRSDLRTFEESNSCQRTAWYEAQLFQRKSGGEQYDCQQSEQSINLKQCGEPPIIETPDCAGVKFRYVYKVWPWAPLDEHIFSQHPETFHNINAVVLSNGRWYPYWDDEKHGALDIEQDLERYLSELRKLYSGPIIFQSEYAEHETFSLDNAVQCSHASCDECDEQPHCSYTAVESRPDRLDIIRRVMQRNKVPYIDRWKISERLPHTYYDRFYCNTDFFHSWYCDHHLLFVGMQHLNVVENVLSRMLSAT